MLRVMDILFIKCLLMYELESCYICWIRENYKIVCNNK